MSYLIGLRCQKGRRTYIVLYNRVKSGWYHSMLPRPNCCLLITTMKHLDSLSVLVSVFLDLFFTPKLDWKPYVQSVPKQASQRVGSLFRSWRYLTRETIQYLYKATICPCMGCCSHIWGGAPQSGCLDLLDRSRGWSI